ncbi:uncharacterized protein K02A2.6-like [Octopus sinensis]|uniref:Uncharacterized protein K02A2.6-like n=1 Tax=Octopus sinensis TaxID=2607531 RepID=A0A6P7TEL4_9MOLL|nr:uncharacterized protein K02A2.6-like [Octopus sinensis]
MFNYPLPTPEDIFAKLDSGKIFSKLDLSDAYLQIRLDDECFKYLTINIHKGLYKYNRLSFGLKVTLVIFEQIMDAMLANCEFAIVYLDDILIKSGSRSQHVQHVKKTFKKLNEYRFTLSRDSSVWG